jgi:hypothetical protein
MRARPWTAIAIIVFGVGILWAQPPRTIHGFVSDARCGAMHNSPSVDATRCMQKCRREGSPPVIMSSGKVYQVKGDAADVAEYIGQYVTVQGVVDGDTITVLSISSRVLLSPARSIASAR